METRIDALEKQGTWELVTLPQNRKLIQTKWVCDLTLDYLVKVVRANFRLAAKGFTQTEGAAFAEGFLSVFKYSTVRFFTALSVDHACKPKLSDTKDAFINAPLNETIYIS